MAVNAHHPDASPFTLRQAQRTRSEPDLLPSLKRSQPLYIAGENSASHVASTCSSCDRSPPLDERRSHYRRHCRSRHRPLSHTSARAFKASLLNEEAALDDELPARLHDEGLGDASSVDSTSLASVFADESPERASLCTRDSAFSSYSPDAEPRQPSNLRRCQSSPNRRVRISDEATDVTEPACGHESN
eukprot:m.44371 g.44371  ORF g.44371 m.44371 type:complete len:189 (-) comp13008_c0_seq1:961-1527(-)